MNQVWRSIGRAGVGAAMALGVGGCGLIPIAALTTAGAVADISSDVLSTGTEVYSYGKLESVEVTHFDTCVNAVRDVADELQLRITSDTRDKATREFELVDDFKDKIDINLTPRTPVLCHIKIDVGLFGSEPMARLLLKRLRAHLPMDQLGATTMPADENEVE